MFQKIDFKGLAKSKLFGYVAEVPFFKGRKSLEFKPGLNILFGPNGSGKSTVLGMLGQTMCATQGGVSVLTQDCVSNTVDMFATLKRKGDGDREAMVDKLGLKVHHDGQPVLFSDPRKAVGLVGGSFDDDFFDQGVQEAMSASRRSHGQLTLSRSNAALAALLGKVEFPAEVRVTMSKKHVNDLWVQAIELVEERMKGNITAGQRTVLLDEPEANFSLVWQQRLWKLLSNPQVAQDFQVIVASHSPFSLGIGHAHYIDFEPGYREEVFGLLSRHFAPSATTPAAAKASA